MDEDNNKQVTLDEYLYAMGQVPDTYHEYVGQQAAYKYKRSSVKLRLLVLYTH